MTISRKLRYFIEYLGLRLVAGMFSILPYDSAIKTGAAMGRLAALVSRKRFLLTKNNILGAFPQMAPQQAHDTAIKSWENIGVLAAEVAKCAGLSREELVRTCDITNPEVLQGLMGRRKGAIVHIGHLGNWELMAMCIAARGLPSCAVARHIRNPYVDAFISRIRTCSGLELIFHRDPFFSCVRNLRRGKMVGILMDQNYPGGEIYTRFLGRMASTTPLTALLALKAQVPIIPTHVTRRNGRTTITFEEPIIPDQTYSHENMFRLINRLNACLERWIKAEPDMWLWPHNRWKREADALRFMQEHPEALNGTNVDMVESHEAAKTA